MTPEVVPLSSSGRRERHVRPDGVDDATVAAVGKVSEAMEWVERARGRLYDFHQMMGHADFMFEEGADALAECGHDQLAEELRTNVVGRNVLDGRWTFQVIEEFDDLYYEEAHRCDRRVREQLTAGRRHVFEAELKEARRTRGIAGHEAEPA